MNFSDPKLLYIAMLLAVPVLTVSLLNLLLRKRGGLLRGWTGALFIGLCWIGALALIVIRLRS